MATTDPRVDAYIERAQPFAQPILKQLRQWIHTACPNVSETIKWSFPHFEYAGATLCSFASFKAHCVMSFRHYELLQDPEGYLRPLKSGAMGNLGRITRLEDLPPARMMLGFIGEAASLNEQGIKPTRTNAPATRELPPPHPDFEKALQTNFQAREIFETMRYSCRKEYLEWIAEAKSEPTRQRRIEKALGQIRENKSLNWKYEKSGKPKA